MLLYDNLEDVKSKLVGTNVLYDGKAVYVKDAQHDPEADVFILGVQSPGRAAKRYVRLNDPKLNFMNFSLGYSNHNGGVVWWYRVPQRQYRQGIRIDNLGRLVSRRDYLGRVEPGFTRPIADMLEGVYPKFEEVEQKLRDGENTVMAFHKDFAVSWDRIHQDMILEYKGKLAGSVKSARDFRLLDEYQHLTEAFKEAAA